MKRITCTEDNPHLNLIVSLYKHVRYEEIACMPLEVSEADLKWFTETDILHTLLFYDKIATRNEIIMYTIHL